MTTADRQDAQRDGVSLNNIAHPCAYELNPDSLETIEIELPDRQDAQRTPLTDEKILEIENAEFDNYCVDKESKGRKTATITDPEWAVWFARAIEEAHGIK